MDPERERDNAPMVSSFKTLEVERTYRRRYISRNQARLDIVNWIEGLYRVNDLCRSVGGGPQAEGIVELTLRRLLR